MKIQLLIAISDSDYMEHLSRVLMEKYADAFEVSACSGAERVETITAQRKFDVALLEMKLAEHANLQAIQMPLLLWDDKAGLGQKSEHLMKIRKYQRISNMTSQILGQYAEVFVGCGELDGERASMTVVWSPTGGCGKTTTALA